MPSPSTVWQVTFKEREKEGIIGWWEMEKTIEVSADPADPAFPKAQVC